MIMSNIPYSGSIVASITPFRNGKVDLKALSAHISWQIEEGTQGIVLCGSTGEGMLLTAEERHLVLSTALSTAAGRIPIIAGCGAASTHQTISLVREAQALGCPAALVVTPYYVKPTAEGIYQHFAAINDACEIPLIAYNNPGRSIADMSIDLVVRLASLNSVIALKDSHPDVSRPAQLRKLVPQDFLLLSGEDHTTAAFLANGGDGVISVAGNIAPRLFRNLTDSWRAGDLEIFKASRDAIALLYGPMSAESNPGPVKYAVSRLGYCINEFRLPLLPITDKTSRLIDDVLEQLNLIKEPRSHGVAHG